MHRQNGLVGLSEVLIAMDCLDSWWAIRPVEEYGEAVDAHGTRASELEALQASGKLVRGLDLLKITNAVTQVVWGTFSAYRTPDGGTPWIIVKSIDSSFYEITADEIVLERLQRAGWS